MTTTAIWRMALADQFRMWATMATAMPQGGRTHRGLLDAADAVEAMSLDDPRLEAIARHSRTATGELAFPDLFWQAGSWSPLRFRRRDPAETIDHLLARLADAFEDQAVWHAETTPVRPPYLETLAYGGPPLSDEEADWVRLYIEWVRREPVPAPDDGPYLGLLPSMWLDGAA